MGLFDFTKPKNKKEKQQNVSGPDFQYVCPQTWAGGAAP